MFDWITDAIGGSLWTYPIVSVVVAIDSFLPLVPGETVVITAGVVAADGELRIVAVALAAALGGVIGDNISYGLGASLGRRAERRLFRSAGAAEKLDWASDHLRERGVVIIPAARFIPGGRSATTFAAGMLELPWRRFVVIDTIAASIWATYASLLGYFGGQAFTESLWKPLLAAGLVAIAVTVLAEVLRRAVTAPGARTRDRGGSIGR